MKMIAVRFRKPWQGYNTGEIAGFFVHHARRLVNELGVAEYLDPPAPRRARIDDGGAADVGGYDALGWEELRAVYKTKFGRMPRSRTVALRDLKAADQ